MPEISGIRAAFIPAVQDLGDLIALSLMSEGPGGLLPFVTGVALYLNFLEDPLFFHIHSPRRAQRAPRGDKI
jgi:hypothetical protein